MFGITAFAQAPFSTLAGNVFSASVNETAAGFDVVDTNAVQALAVFEASAVADSPAADVGFGVSISELAAASEQLVALVDFAVNAAESARTIDVFETNANSMVFIAERVVAVDSTAIRLTWELIDDSQSVSWQNVVASADGGWSVIGNSQPTSWTNINNKG